jgi:hypothetical protein
MCFLHIQILNCHLIQGYTVVTINPNPSRVSAPGQHGGKGGPLRGISMVYIIYKKLNAKITLLKVEILYLTVYKNKIKSNKRTDNIISACHFH